MIETIFFYLFAGLMLVAALGVVLSRHPISSVLSLLASMFCLAALFVMLQAYFLAAIQILLYAGAVLVLFLFVIMLLNLSSDALKRLRLFTLPAAGIVAAGLLLIALQHAFLAGAPHPAAAPELGAVEPLGRELFRRYLLPFELVSFLILGALLGAVTLTRQDTPPS
ncbi:MAG TPA: NADH-quinone oxidoreductase subunit J [bacterium]